MNRNQAKLGEQKYTKHDILDASLRGKLGRGVWGPGDKLPSESELMEQYGVSRTLVRDVLAGLIHDELIESIHGKGSFVLSRKIHAHAPSQNKIRDQLEQMGYITRIETLDFQTLPAASKLASMLKIETGESVYLYIHRRFVDGQPFSVSESYMPQRLFPGLDQYDLQATPLSDVMEENYGYTTYSANEFLEAIFAPPEVAKQLELTRDYPLLKFEQLSYSKNDIPFELNRILFRGDRIRLHFDYNR